MKLPRRTFLHLAAGVAALPAVSQLASADAYPSRPVHLIVGFNAGTATDIVARIVGQALAQRLGQQIVIENRPGASTNIATEAVARAPADGYTLLLVGAPAVTNVSLYPNLNFNFVRDIAPVASISRTAFVMVVNPAFPAKSVPEFIAYAKANPGKITMASGGNGTMSHVAGELFKTMAGIDMLHVPYRGDFMPDVLSGRVTVVFSAIAQSIGDIKDGRLRALAVTSTMRQEMLPDVPAVAEFVPGYDATAFYGIAAPNGTPAEIIDKLNREANATLADPALKAKLLEFGSTVVTSSPADFEKFIAAEIDKWGKVIRADNIHPDQ
jgi:tripartite-type tricarboxylate transporter receptor subunit TctC